MPELALQTRFVNFIAWLRPPPEGIEEIRKQRNQVKRRIQEKAEADGLLVRAMPAAGSFAKATDLRRRLVDGVEHEGQDVDCAMVIADHGLDGDSPTELLPRFERYARACYPDARIERTRSSVKIRLTSAKVDYNLMPALAVGGADDEQILLRPRGERPRTSIQKHVDFVRRRTEQTQELRGPVLFNEAVRLVKWWREQELSSSAFIEEIPSFLVELLCAKAFDAASIWAGYAETLMAWFDQIRSYAARRSDVTFDGAVPEPDRDTAPWRVIDPVNAENNAVPASWGDLQIEELCDWAGRAKETLRHAIAAELRGRSADAVTLVTEILGSSFRVHSEA